MKKSLTKYKIGLAVIVLFVLVLTIMVIAQTSDTKQDNTTYNQASDIANQLNNYFDGTRSIPSTLSAAGISNVPSTVTYQKVSDTTYQFCVDFKSTSSGFDPTSAESTVLSAATGDSQDSSNNQYYGGDNSTLYVNTDHHKGENCQKVQPILPEPSDNISDPYAACDSIQDNTLYQDCINNANSQNSTDGATTN